MFGLWVGSAVAGWYLFWLWLAVPVVVISLHILRMSANMRALRERNGLPLTGGVSMAGANTRLLLFTLVQHSALFGIGAGAHWLFG